MSLGEILLAGFIVGVVIFGIRGINREGRGK